MLHDERFSSVDLIQRGFEKAGYICSRGIAGCVHLARHLEKPILVEGPAGVGKTELGKVTAAYMGLPLIRLQCYEGLDESRALYEWKYGKQLLYTQILREKINEFLAGTDDLASSMAKLRRHDDIFFSMEFLEPRPLLRALLEPEGAVLLIDEVDKSDPEFEAFLLEVLSDYQVSVPEIGTIRARKRPFVFLTSNNTREMSEPLKRRCLHLFIPFPDPKVELKIVHLHAPDLADALRSQVVAFIHQIRKLDLKKAPSVSETIDWAKALLLLNATGLSTDLIRDTLNLLLKFEEDIEVVQENLRDLKNKAGF